MLIKWIFLFCAQSFATNFEVIPFNGNSEKFLKASPLAPYVVSLNHEQEDFSQKTNIAFKKMSFFLKTEKFDALDFIYDSRFLTDAAFFTKYSSLHKVQLIKVRKIASEVYSK